MPKFAWQSCCKGGDKCCRHVIGATGGGIGFLEEVRWRWSCTRSNGWGLWRRESAWREVQQERRHRGEGQVAALRHGGLKPGCEVATVQGTAPGGLSTTVTSSPGMMRSLGTRAKGGLMGGKVGGGGIVSVRPEGRRL